MPTKEKQRSDSQRNLAKVAAIALKNPEAKQRDIAKQAWVGKWTVHRKLEQLGQVKSDFVESVLSKDKEIILKAQQIIADKLDDEKYIKTIKPYEVAQVAKISADRFALFKWDATDDEGGLKDPRDYTLQEMEDYLFKKKKWQQ